MMKKERGLYLQQGQPGKPLLVGLHGFGMSAGDEWWRHLSYPKRSGLLKDVVARGWNAIFVEAGPGRNWTRSDGLRVAQVARDYAASCNASRVVGFAHSDGVLGQLAADSLDGALYAALVCVGGVYDPEVLPRSGCRMWFTCGEHDVGPVKDSLTPFVDAYRAENRDVTATRIPGARHGWPVEFNQRFMDWCDA